MTLTDPKNVLTSVGVKFIIYKVDTVFLIQIMQYVKFVHEFMFCDSHKRCYIQA